MSIIAHTLNDIYAVRNDSYKYQELDLDINDFLDDFPEEIGFHEARRFSFENIAMSEWWKTPSTRFVPIKGEIGQPVADLSKWDGATLALSPKAYRFLGDTLKSWGELLPINIKDETYYIFNCLTLGEVDEDRCEKEYYEGEEVGIKHLAFDSQDVERKLIFKTPFQGCLDLFCGDSLKEAIESFGLTGVRIESNLVREYYAE